MSGESADRWKNMLKRVNRPFQSDPWCSQLPVAAVEARPSDLKKKGTPRLQVQRWVTCFRISLAEARNLFKFAKKFSSLFYWAILFLHKSSSFFPVAEVIWERSILALQCPLRYYSIAGVVSHKNLVQTLAIHLVPTLLSLQALFNRLLSSFPWSARYAASN